MKWHYLVHLLGWTMPLLALQWAAGWKVFRRNLRALFVPAVVGGVFFSAIDQVAVRSGLWFFDPAQIIGWHIGRLPVEEVLFFFVTSLLVTHSLVLLLPRGYRRD